MKKRFLAAVLAAVMAVTALTGCSSQTETTAAPEAQTIAEDKTTEAAKPETTAAATTEATVETTAEPTAEPTAARMNVVLDDHFSLIGVTPFKI